MIAAFVVLIGGASFLYNKLSPKVAAERLSTNITTPADDSQKITLSEAQTSDKQNLEKEENAGSDISSEQGGSVDSGLSSEQTASTDTNDKADASDDSDVPAAPDFTVYDIDGDAVSLSDFIGKPVIINFWASWCGPCKMEMPEFEEKYNELGDDIQFLMVNLTDGNRETIDTASAFIEEQGYLFPVYYDTDFDAAITYGVYSLPSTLFIDAEGYGIAQAVGAIDRETLQRGIDLILP